MACLGLTSDCADWLCVCVCVRVCVRACVYSRSVVYAKGSVSVSV